MTRQHAQKHPKDKGASGSFLPFIRPIRDLFFKDGNVDEAFRVLCPHMENKKLSRQEQQAVFELAGLLFRENHQYAEAVKAYNHIDEDYQAGYCEMLQGNGEAARQYWFRLVKGRETHWCVTLFGCMSGQVLGYPSAFQIRNHIESDVVNLIRAKQFGYLENLLSIADTLAQINPETYKLLGRALMYAEWWKPAEEFLKKGQKMLPNDPEIYFHLGQYTAHQGYHKDCRILLNQCLLISPAYTPAQAILETLPPTT